MCLIIHKPEGSTVPKWVIESALEYNNDGFGVMAEGKARKWKYRTLEQIQDILGPLEAVNAALHFRMATDGLVNKSNAHPFKLRNRAWLMHNGMLSKYRTSKTDKISDTRKFIDTFCNPLISEHGSIPTAKLEEEIWGNTICLMQKDGEINRYGSGWTKHDGNFFSNEYAWDSPTYQSKYGISDYLGSDYPLYTKEELAVESSDYLSESMLDVLLQVTDILPFNDVGYVAYSDVELQDEILDGEITPKDFLEFCSAETLLLMYTWAAQHNHIEI